MNEKGLDDVLLLALAALGDVEATAELGRGGAGVADEAIHDLKTVRASFLRRPTFVRKPTLEPWRVGKEPGVVVSNNPVYGGPSGANDFHHYGGYLIAESVSPSNAERIVVCVNACAGLEEKDIIEAVSCWRRFKRNIVL